MTDNLSKLTHNTNRSIPSDPTERVIKSIPALGLVFNEFERQIEKLSTQILSGGCASFDDYKGAVSAIRTLNACVRQGKQIAAEHLTRSDDNDDDIIY